MEVVAVVEVRVAVAVLAVVTAVVSSRRRSSSSISITMFLHASTTDKMEVHSQLLKTLNGLTLGKKVLGGSAEAAECEAASGPAGNLSCPCCEKVCFSRSGLLFGIGEPGTSDLV